MCISCANDVLTQALPLSEMLGRRAAEGNAFEYYEAKWGLDGCKIPPGRQPWTQPLKPASAPD